MRSGCARPRTHRSRTTAVHAAVRGAVTGVERGGTAAQAALRRMTGTLIGREPGPPTCEKGWVRQSSP
ncbi:hypothetical protein GCM10010423_70880 [Streptomyces levis]|uniref:Uncharacterized protein n=1 Tax=Streptomyces levis TaxID=285566 RepID=A0ABP6BDD4_9ACTN